MYLYIMGRGYSGSTILDILLGGSDRIESVGELIYGLSRAGREVCSCGEPIPACPFWREVRQRTEAEGVDWDEACRANATQLRASTQFWRVWCTRPNDPAAQRLAWITTVLERAITATAGKQHVLDSGKTPARALFLLRHLPEARAIHLVRDPRHVMRSYLWRLEPGNVGFLLYGRRRAWGKMLPLVLASGLWTVSNLSCELIARRYPDRVVRIRYEDLRAQPEAVLVEIGRAFALNLDDVRNKLRRDESFAVGHNIGGNRIRHEGAVRFDPAKSGRRSDLPRWLKVVTTTFCWPLMLRYGYWPGGEAGALRSRLSDTTAS